MCERRTLPDIELCKERGFAVSLGEWRREIFGVAAPLYRTPSGDCLSVNCGIPSFRFNAEQIERECGPRILGLARSIRSLVGQRLEYPRQRGKAHRSNDARTYGEGRMSGIKTALGFAVGIAAMLLGRRARRRRAIIRTGRSTSSCPTPPAASSTSSPAP